MTENKNIDQAGCFENTQALPQGINGARINGARLHFLYDNVLFLRIKGARLHFLYDNVLFLTKWSLAPFIPPFILAPFIPFIPKASLPSPSVEEPRPLSLQTVFSITEPDLFFITELEILTCYSKAAYYNG